ncbi:hypothetical protein IC762_12515 [Bradyrhizobium genosp. L]|uniref:hypothetical protein n=1 Tax=Bradyrhizobium genosp. L TaxID=83637 RepID=UPI0018A2E3E0|nr:hypothetical protein [Bradyrhizobium genosp. L]QPF81713.1 hypothetical protein IC762_17985 [Bradyrhizobium genosp. L]QPF87065.1 hypothetical protein IC762_12515 [Bradyrhizobium genosp. L]
MTTPYLRGVADAAAGKPGPAIPKINATWAEKLYNRGWCDGRDAKAAAERERKAQSGEDHE